MQSVGSSWRGIRLCSENASNLGSDGWFSLESNISVGWSEGVALVEEKSVEVIETLGDEYSFVGDSLLYDCADDSADRARFTTSDVEGICVDSVRFQARQKSCFSLSRLSCSFERSK